MKITVKQPVEVEDDVFIKYLIIYKRWLATEEMPADKEVVRDAFVSQLRPKKTLW